jgi:hypothetical protein
MPPAIDEFFAALGDGWRLTLPIFATGSPPPSD